MKKANTLKTVAIIIVCIIGSIPGLWTMLINNEGPFQRPEGAYWKALVIGIPSVLAAILAGYFLSKYLLKKFYSENRPVLRLVVIISLVTIISGLVAVLVGWEVDWLIAKVFGWGGVAEVPWKNLFIGIPIILAYSILPVTITGLIYGVFSFAYLNLDR